MSLATGSFGFAPAPLVNPAIMPNNFGSAGSLNNPYNWGYTNMAAPMYQDFGLGLDKYQAPYSTQNYLPFSQQASGFSGNAQQFGQNGMESGFNTIGQFNQGNSNSKQNGSGKNGNKNGKSNGWQDAQQGMFSGLFPQNKQKNPFGKKDEEEDPYEKWKEEQEEKMEEEREEFVEDVERLVILAAAFLVLDQPSAQYFAATEMFSVFLTKLGVNDAMNMIILLVIQCVDFVALFRGRFKLVEGYHFNWYQELYDTILTVLDVPDLIRLGSQYFMPQSPAPDYEAK